MSWSVYITDADGNSVRCNKCTLVAGCQIVKVAPSIAAVLTSIHNTCDGDMITGTAKLECNAFNLQPEEPMDGAEDGSAEDDNTG